MTTLMKIKSGSRIINNKMTSGNCLLGAVSLMLTFKCFNLFYIKTQNFPYIHLFVKDKDNNFWSFDKNCYKDVIPIIWFKGFFNKRLKCLTKQPTKIFNIC